MSQPEIHEENDEFRGSSLNARISARVRALRKQRGLTLRQLSERMKGVIAYQNLSAMELEKQEWRASHLEAVAKALGVSPRELLPEAPDSDTLNTLDTLDPLGDMMPNPAALTHAELELVGALRGFGAQGAVLVDALNALAGAAHLQANARGAAAPDAGELVGAANSDKPPGSTRAKLGRLLEPRRMGATEPPRPTSRKPKK